MTIPQGDIVAEIVKFGMVGLFPGAPEPNLEKLKTLSLQDMLDAVRQVERDNAAAASVDGKRTFSVVPDDRLTATVFTFLNYCGPGQHDVGDDDDAILHLKIGDARHGLIKWARHEVGTETADE